MPGGVTCGMPEPLGVSLTATGVNVAVFSAHATAIEFCLFDAAGMRELRRVRLPERTGDVFHGHIADVAEGARYGLRAHGPFLPREGHRFNPSKLLLDPYTSAINRPFRLAPSMFGHDDTDSAPDMPKGIVLRPGIAARGASPVPWSRTVLYELHVRGFTMRHPAIPENLRGTFAGLAHPAAIDHLTQLGVTSVEIMPAAAWIEERHLAAAGLTNYWGYNPVTPMAPDPRLAPGGWQEIRATVAQLATAGIETILDVVLNHTGEGDALGPTLSLRGLDNASYYRLTPDDPAHYVDDAGCGNTLALDRPPVLRLAMDALRTWAGLAGVHGFRFDLATTLGRRADGFDPAAPLLAAIAQDPALRALKLIAEPWDLGPGGYRAGAFPAGWGEWNDRFRDDARRFWRGEPGQLGPLATRLAGSSDLFAAKRRPSRGVNFIAAHDGFTLADLVSYQKKHNEANGEANRDGTEANLSWNNGEEGPSDDPAVRASRARDQRALLATLLLARGTPMLAMGSELGQTQRGNNNAYAQDNATAWLDWDAADAGLLAWTRLLIGIRRDHPALREDRFLTGQLADVEWRRPDGAPLADADWRASDGDALVMALTSTDAMARDRVILVLNRAAAPVDVALPEPDDGHGWRVLADSATGEAAGGMLDADQITAASRSVLVLAEQPNPARRQACGGETLDRLARAAGIAPVWWEVNGTRHAVGDDTKRALLAAMRLPAGTSGEARNSLERLARELNHRALPYAIIGYAGEPIELLLVLEPGLGRRSAWLTLALEDGEIRRHRIGAEDGALTQGTAIDGSRLQCWRITLPPQPLGRHRVWRDDAPDVVCHLTVAPRRCHMPPALAGGTRLFGVSAQLYALRRAGDQGVGDFTTLGDLAEAAAQAGAATIGLNPLHALFAGQRDRASPYHPSDRRFLDPIYLDVSRLDDGFDRSEAHALSALPAVDYPSVWALKRQVLERHFATFEASTRHNPGAEPARAFAAFVARGGAALARFAAFEAIAETRPGQPWRYWPAALQQADAAPAERVRFHLYLQFLCETQLAEAACRGRAGGLALGFIRDLAVGAAPDGAEAWAHDALLGQGVSIGAPPDPFAAEGQIWGLPPPDPLDMLRSGFAAFADLLAANMRHAGGLRIDHAMGLTRLFWVPEGASGADGAYVAYPFAHLLGQVTLASTRANCLVVGEDLGTVPEGFRETLAEADVLSYRVLLLERAGIGFKPPEAYPAKALACVSTHDLPTLAGWWEGADIAESASLGLLPADAASDAKAERTEEKSALAAALGQPDAAAASDIAMAAHAYVGRAPSCLVLAQADDLAGERIAVNLPGTDTERPNWRRKLAPPVTDLFRTEAARAILDGLRKTRAG
jgi:glycogen debranching enzyme GlgX/4-alpha-glucanotransferase